MHTRSAALAVLAALGGCNSSSSGPQDQASVASVHVAPHSDALAVGDTTRLSVVLSDSAGNVLSGPTITWTSSNPTAAAVTSSGLVTALAAGSASIKASSQGKSDSAAVTVSAPPPPPPPPPPSGGAPFGHVFLVVLENNDYSLVIGNAAMPYLNGLANQYALATQYYATTHPSIGNYFSLTVGDTITNNDDFTGIVSANNVIRQLIAAGKTWKSYAEDMPYAGFTGSSSGNYARYHNPAALLSDVRNDATQVMNLVPFTQLATDLANNTLPNYATIIPNLCSDAHNCSLATADTWLKNNIDPLITSATFQQDGLLIITFDESESTSINGGGRVAWVVVGSKAKRGYRSTTPYQHWSTLRLMMKALGVTTYPNKAATAPDMDEFLQ